MVFALRPVDKYVQSIKAHFHIAIRGLCLLLSVNAYIDFIQTLFGQGNRIAIAEDGIGTLIVLILVGRGHIYQPQLIAKALRGNDQIGQLEHFFNFLSPHGAGAATAGAQAVIITLCPLAGDNLGRY